MSLVFLCVNVACGVLGDRDTSGERGNRTWNLVLVRVIINDLLFIMAAVLLATLLLRLARHSRSTSAYLMSKVCRTFLQKWLFYRRFLKINLPCHVLWF